MTVDVKIDATGVKRLAGADFMLAGGWTWPGPHKPSLRAVFGRADTEASAIRDAAADGILADIPAAVRRILDEPEEDTLAMAQSRERYWSRRCADAEAERDAAAALARRYRDELDARGVRWFWQR